MYKLYVENIELRKVIHYITYSSFLENQKFQIGSYVVSAIRKKGEHFQDSELGLSWANL
jgi:hypothetical protein